MHYYIPEYKPYKDRNVHFLFASLDHIVIFLCCGPEGQPLWTVSTRFPSLWLLVRFSQREGPTRDQRVGERQKYNFYSPCPFPAGLQFGDGYVISTTDATAPMRWTSPIAINLPGLGTTLSLCPFRPRGSNEISLLLVPECFTFLC